MSTTNRKTGARAAAPAPAPAETAAPADPQAAPGAHPSEGSTEAVVHAWLFGHIHGGPISRNVECWNALQAALPALVALLKGA